MSTGYAVSIVIPVFNRPDLLRCVLRDLARQTICADLMQILVCDDGSTDDLSEVIRDFQAQLPGLQHLRQPNKGPAAARNLGTRRAAADIVLYLDSDVLVDEHMVQLLVTALHQNPDWVGAEARVEPIDGEPNILWDAPVCEHGGVYLTAAIACRREALRQVGGFDENFLRAACEDVELAARLLPLGDIGFVPEARIRHPRRRKTCSMFWKKRQDWRYVLYLAQRHGFIAWPGNPTSRPRLRLLWCALVTQPAGRLLGALRLAAAAPSRGAVAAAHAVFSWFCGLAAVPDLLTATVPEPHDYLAGDRQEQPAVPADRRAA
ncbi:MAG: glycosyltransferase family A protein [Fuerstiella sp.]